MEAQQRCKLLLPTYSDDLHAGILQPVCSSDGVILRFAVSQQQQKNRRVWSGACLGLQVLLHDMKQRLSWEATVRLRKDKPARTELRRHPGTFLPVKVFPPLYRKFRTPSSSCSLLEKVPRSHSVRGSPLY